MNHSKIRWGILGTGAIAHKFATGLLQSKTGTLAAVGSRSEKSAAHFASEFPARCHGSYEELLADPGVDVVYISTPHPMHAKWAIKAADAGKHVLCEKPLTMNHAEALEVVEAARRNDVFLMEAFMYRCHPQTAKLVELIRAGVIGEVRFIRATFSFMAPRRLEGRLLNPGLGGGAILDVGCYPVSMARLIAGAVAGKAFAEPVEVKAVGQIGAESRVDEYAIASLRFPNSIVAQIAAGVQLELDNNVRIVGTKGAILVPNPWVISFDAGFSKIIIFKDHLPEEVVVEFDRGIYAIEADTVAAHLADRQAPAISWDDSLGNMRTLDRWRAEVGMTCDSEEPQA